MKGCPLRCVWCHNPESWTSQSQVLYKKTKCIGCQTCVNVCPQQLLRLTADGIVMEHPCAVCHLCTEECPTTALEMCGKAWTMEALMAEIEKERAVMEDSGGGVTLCGGEPLMHPDYTLQLLHDLGRRGFHRTVDTSLYAPQEVVAEVAKECELILADLKIMDPDNHRLYTGVPNDLILQNIRYLADYGHPFLIRIPLIEGINADEQNMDATGRFLASLRTFVTVHLLPYHDVGKDKHRRMLPPSVYNPQNYPMSSPTDETLDRCSRQLEAYGLSVIIGG
jgi:pyruvate formate lyase activating enzyme